jgi:glycosyltransferase involved in cell wall biosynthesis
MRVAIVSKTFVADTAQRQLEWIARQSGLELTLITPPEWRADDGRVLPFIPRFTAGYAYRLVPVAFNGRYHFYVYRGLLPALRSLAPDLVHIDEEPYNPAGAQAQRAADALGAPSIFVAWQSIFRSYPPPYSWLEQYDYRHTAHVIAGNAATADVLRRKGYAGPISTFSLHGVDPDLYQPPAHRVPHDGFIIGYIGRLVLYKGVGLLIEALDGLPPSCRLRLVGSGPDEAELRVLARDRGVTDRVEFAPAVPATAIPGVLAGMDVLALPSLTRPNWMEQFGRVLIEAMACGVPVVGSDSGEIPNVIADAGLIVPEGDAAPLRIALANLLAQPDQREALARQGRARVLERFTQEQVARKIATVYQQVFGGREHPRTAQRGASLV